MKTNVDEIKAYVEQLWPDAKVSVGNTAASLVIDVEQMYEYVDLKLYHLKKLSDFLQTDNIDTDKTAYGGCETCDYGSSYTVQLIARP